MKYPTDCARFVITLFVVLLFPRFDIAASMTNENDIVYSENMTNEELQEFAAVLYALGTKTAETLEDVRQNDGQRRYNLATYVPTLAAQQKVEPYLWAIPRPECENEVLFQEITRLLEDTSNTKYRSLSSVLSERSTFRFSTTDKRLYTLVLGIVQDECHVMNRETACLGALEFLGCIHIPECVAFLTQARRPEYWEQETSIKTLQREARHQACRAMINVTVAAIERLPLDNAIRLLEEMYTWPPYFEKEKRSILESLDFLWQRKKGEFHLRGKVSRMPWGAWAPGPTSYPEWLYGPDGKRVDWPFGYSPNETEEQRIENAEYLAHCQRQKEEKAKAFYQNAEAERKKKAQEEAAAPK